MATEKKGIPKGILKSSSSFDKTEAQRRKEMKWDEMNILATHHPEDKTYGHMKIDEPPTPYSRMVAEEEGESNEEGVQRPRRSSCEAHSEDEHDGVSAADLAARLQDDQQPKVLSATMDHDDESSEEDDAPETDEQKAKRKSFEMKRKIHYNEYQAMKLAKQMMAEEEEEDEAEDENNDNSNVNDKITENNSLCTEQGQCDLEHESADQRQESDIAVDDNHDNTK